MEFSESNNKVSVVGTIVEPVRFDHESYGTSFYRFIISVPRYSGNEDKILVIAASKFIEDNDYTLGDELMITGQYRSFNDMSSGRSKLILTLFAKTINYYCSDDSEPIKNSIYLNGFVCKKPVYRITPFGKEIADVLVAVNRGFSKADYIPVIVWGYNARKTQDVMVGDNLQIWGRIQSRTYFKSISETEKEEHTTYEVSANRVEINMPRQSDDYMLAIEPDKVL